MASVENVVNVASRQALDDALERSKDKLAVLFFSANWHPPCAQMAEVVRQLSKDHPSVAFFQVEAEELPEVSGAYDIISVPTFVFIKNGNRVDRLEGANAPELVKRVASHSHGNAAAGSTVVAPPSAEDNSDLVKIINASPIMLFMKGTPDAPRCGFSQKMVNLLREYTPDFGYFDILSNDSVRQRLKTFSNWPTYPQLYVKGKLLGGLDIATELHREGQLGDELRDAAVPAPKEDLNTRLRRLIQSSRIMLFMKGSPDAPRCGFSQRVVNLLNGAHAQYGSFDILSDEEVRQGLKTYSNWPTYPQLYVDGKLVGGLDILQELQQSGELADVLGLSS